MSTQFPSKPLIERRWHVLDAEGVVLGKLASDAAKILMGKTKTSWTPFMDTGDHVIVINADKVVLTGKKDEQKLYRHFTGYPGGLVETKAKKVRADRPIRMVEEAISGMLAENETRQADVSQAEGVCGRQAPARGAETGSPGGAAQDGCRLTPE